MTAFLAIALASTSFQALPSLVAEFNFGNFRDPHGISVDPGGNIYVVNTGRNLLMRFNPAGDSTGEVGGFGWGEYQFDQPFDVCATNGVEIYVADYNNHRIQRFDQTLANVASLSTNQSNDDSKRFGYPSGVAVSRLGDLFICDNEDIRILKVNTFSTVERTFGGYGEGVGTLTMPRQVSVGPNDEVFVSDKGRVAVYDNFGSYLTSIGVGVLRDPGGIGVSDDKIGVCDSDTLYFFNFDGELISRFSTSDVLGAKADHFNDVSINGKRIYILTDKNVIVARSSF
jgi:DNA-binding beta-propeller fold protein YncE